MKCYWKSQTRCEWNKKWHFHSYSTFFSDSPFIFWCACVKAKKENLNVRVEFYKGNTNLIPIYFSIDAKKKRNDRNELDMLWRGMEKPQKRKKNQLLIAECIYKHSMVLNSNKNRWIHPWSVFPLIWAANNA